MKLFLGIALLASAAVAAPLRLTVDATDAPRGMLHARMVIPVAAGEVTLAYPKWIPGEHSPAGPITNLVGLEVRAGGKRIAWRRDPIDLFLFHVEVPAGASELELRFDYLLPSEGLHTEGVSATSQLAIVDWHNIVLYPRGRPATEISVAASLKLPPGWRFATALPQARAQGDSVAFQPASLETLVDSPVIAGAHLRAIPLGGTPAHEVDLVADEEIALQAAPALVDSWKRLVAQTGALFGARHYRNYHFLVTLSDALETNGIEHHESTDIRMRERAVVDEQMARSRATLLPHEFTHSWIGKYRRPTGLVTTDFQDPQRTELLWVYEGLTSYYGWVLAARSGLSSTDDAHDALADCAAAMEHHPGRSWRPLEDTAVAAQLLYRAESGFASWRRSVDFYTEMVLVWLEVDTRIRKATDGKRSLDDFARSFFGAASGPPEVRPYTFDDVVAGLEKVAPGDWRGLLTRRLRDTSDRAPLDGIAAAGWRLGYAPTRSPLQRASDDYDKRTELRWSIGVVLDEKMVVLDAVAGSPAARAGIAPGMKLVAVDGFKADPDRLYLQVAAARGTLDVISEQADFFRTHHVEWRGGSRYPRLERDAAKPDLLEKILAPKAE